MYFSNLINISAVVFREKFGLYSIKMMSPRNEHPKYHQISCGQHAEFQMYTYVHITIRSAIKSARTFGHFEMMNFGCNTRH